MDAVNPTPEPLQKMLADTPKDQPVVMLDPLRFRDRVSNKEEAPECSGHEVYQLYMEEAAACVKSVGAEVIWSGRAVGSLIAPPDESWGQVLVVRYPSIDAFMAMIKSQEYGDTVPYGSAALQNSRLMTKFGERV